MNNYKREYISVYDYSNGLIESVLKLFFFCLAIYYSTVVQFCYVIAAAWAFAACCSYSTFATQPHRTHPALVCLLPVRAKQAGASTAVWASSPSRTSHIFDRGLFFTTSFCAQTSLQRSIATPPRVLPSLILFVLPKEDHRKTRECFYSPIWTAILIPRGNGREQVLQSWMDKVSRSFLEEARVGLA